MIACDERDQLLKAKAEVYECWDEAKADLERGDDPSGTQFTRRGSESQGKSTQEGASLDKGTSKSLSQHGCIKD